MATNTPKLNLVKPGINDNVDITQLNGNMDILDDAITTEPSVDDLADTDISSPSPGDKLVFDGTNWVNLEAYAYVETVYFTSSGTFAKADYPWLRAIRVKAQGAGGGGSGGEATSGSNNLGSTGTGGNGGSYAESFITDIASLSASETVTVGAGGAGGVGPNDGSSGGESSFGTLVKTDTAKAGRFGGRSNSEAIFGTSLNNPGGQVGDIVQSGDPGRSGFKFSQGGTSVNKIWAGIGGGSKLGAAGRTRGNSSTNLNGDPGRAYGGGGNAGSAIPNRADATGGTGAAGIVIVELYA